MQRRDKFLPLPACGERVGVRGQIRCVQIRGDDPSPGLRSLSSGRPLRAGPVGNPTSPRAAGRGDFPRRAFLTLFAGTAAAWPLPMRAQQPAKPVIGYVDAGSQASMAKLIGKFQEGLAETGFADGQNVTIEFRWGEGHHETLLSLAADLVSRRVAVIVATGGEVSAVAAKGSTATIPIVFDTSRDPVELGLVASLNHPGGNATGINQLNAELGAKSVGLMHELVPKAAVIAFLGNPNNPSMADQLKERQEAARAIGLKI